MSLVIILGPPAVGKMTVGLELERLTGLKLFHNHMSIDLARKFFPPESASFGRIVGTIRRVVMEETARTYARGLIFTYVWSFDDPRDAAAIGRCVEIFEAYGQPTYFVELEASLEVRQLRNETELRLEHKPGKRDLEHSRAQLWRMSQKHKNNSTFELREREHYVRIDNTDVAPEEAAARIQKRFGLPLAGA
jgi:hypothetical protein